MIKVSDLIAAFFERAGMDHVFGIIGAGNAHIFDSIGTRGTVEMVCVHHEQAATMAMQTYFRVSGKVTAAVLTTGGGSTNGLTGVVGAWMDSLPGLIISGNENSRFTRTDNPLRIWGIQGYDSSGVVSSVTKYSGRVTDSKRVIFELEKALHIARTGKPGPCWIDIPMDIQASLVDDAEVAHFDPLRDMPVEIHDDVKSAARQCAEMLRQAKRPLLWLGHGIRLANAVDRVKTLIEHTSAPTLVSWAGIDMVDSDHPLVFGRAGTYGQRCANLVLQNCDLIVAVGTRLAIPQIGYVLDELARDAQIVSVDIDHAEAIKHGSRVALPVTADAGKFIDALLDEIGNGLAPNTPWIEWCGDIRERYPWVGPEHADTPDFINSYQFMKRLSATMKPDQIVVTDMGTALLSGHQVLSFKSGQRFMTSTGLGEMGYGLPGAIGASFARDRGEVICLNCDGGMMMNLQELQTVVHHQLPIKLIIFNNDGYLMIKHTQNNLFKGRRVGTDRKTGVSCPDFTKLAHAFGMPAYQIRTWADFDEVIPKLQAEEGPAICEVFMDPQQLFVPKLGLASKADGTLVSPPLEDLSPLLPRDEFKELMITAVLPKSLEL